MSTRKLITISLPPALLRQAEAVARQEHRTRSELLREALRFYVETREVRRKATQQQLAALLGTVQTGRMESKTKRIRTSAGKEVPRGTYRRKRR